MKTAEKTVETIFKSSPNGNEFYKGYGEYLSELLANLDFDAIAATAACFNKAREEGRTIFFAGNGGSTATASHFAQDMAEIVRKVGGKPFKTFSLNDHTAALTAIGNDYDFAQVFSLQMANHFNPGDVLVLISASGNSPNVVKAAELARQRKGLVVSLVGFDGGALAKMSDIVVCVKTLKGEYGPVEDVHLVLNHMLVSYLTLAARHGNKNA
jgi:D-sedoheptulose 7-phosphate isomerase